jgi:hypothetical protein
MHFLTRQRLHLSRFHPLMKSLLTLYVASVALATWVAALKYSDRAEWSPRGAGVYVRGEAQDGGPAAPDAFGDPLAGTPEGAALRPALTRRQLVDIVHPHLFTIPIILFILGHLLHLTRLPDALKLGVNATSFLAFFATFLTPLLVEDRDVLGPLLFVSGTALLASVAAQCGVTLWELWLGKPGAGFDALPRQGP